MRGRRVGMAAEALTVSLEVLNLTVTLRRQREASDRRTIPNMLFTSSVLLARWIVRHEELFQHKRVLELGAGLGLFVVGWVIQFVGHYYEGRKPAFVDDISGLMVGPMFVVAEALFGLGWNTALRERIEREVGPTHLRQLNTLQP